MEAADPPHTSAASAAPPALRVEWELSPSPHLQSSPESQSLLSIPPCTPPPPPRRCRFSGSRTSSIPSYTFTPPSLFWPQMFPTDFLLFGTSSGPCPSGLVLEVTSCPPSTRWLDLWRDSWGVGACRHAKTELRGRTQVYLSAAFLPPWSAGTPSHA